MRCRPFPAVSLLPLLATALAGCADQGSFPSLLPRPIEQADAASPPAATPEPAVPADAALLARLAEIRAGARQGQAAFESQLGSTRSAVAGAGAAESDSWAEAQQALSRLESARAPTMSALADLDVFALGRERAGASGADRAAVAAAREEIEELANRQRAEISRLSDLLPSA